MRQTLGIRHFLTQTTERMSFRRENTMAYSLRYHSLPTQKTAEILRRIDGGIPGLSTYLGMSI